MTTKALLNRYNMTSNVKFVLTIIVGSILFDEPVKLEQVFAIMGVIAGK